MRQDVYETFASDEGIIFMHCTTCLTQQLTEFTGTTYNVLPHTTYIVKITSHQARFAIYTLHNNNTYVI